MSASTLGSADNLLFGNGLLADSLIPELGADNANSGLLGLMEQMGQQPTALSFQDVVEELTPSKSVAPASPLQIPGLNSPNPFSEQTFSPQSFFVNPNSDAVDQLTGQNPGQLQSVEAAIGNPSTPTEQTAILWGVDSHDGQLFQLQDYEQSSPELIDFGQLVVSTGSKTRPLKTVSAFTIDSDQQSAYIAVNRKVGSLRAPWIGKIDLSQVQAGGPNEVTVVGQVDLRGNNDRHATIRGLDIDPISGELYGLLTEKGNDDLVILDKSTGQIKDNLGSIHTGKNKVTSGEDLVFDNQGNLYVMDVKDDELYRVDKTTADILEVVDDKVRSGLGRFRRRNVEVEALAWNPLSQSMIFAEEKQDILGVLSLERGNNEQLSSFRRLGLKDVEGLDFQLVSMTGNTAPEAIADSYEILENGLLSVDSVTGVLANDFDADGDSLTTSLVTSTENGDLVLNTDGSFVYTPDSDFVGTDGFEYAVSDGQGGTDRVTVSIDVQSVNAAPVVLDQGFAIAENSGAGTIVGTISASDPDGDTLTYAITAGNLDNAFSLDSATGSLTVNDASALDFETNPQYSLALQVKDAEGLQDTATVTVEIGDVNEAPVIEPQTFAIDENSSNGTLVGIVNVDDPDAGDVLSYQVIGGTGQSVFAVEDQTGEISVLDASQLDFEVNPSLTLEIEVTDSQGLTDTAIVTIGLNDLPENGAPVVSDQSFTIAENSPNGANVGTVVASDADAGDTLTYAITDGNLDDRFSIDASTGAITLNTPPGADFESQEQYTLTVQVEDETGLTDTATITVNVSDVNESPLIDDQSFGVDENSVNGTLIGTLNADDPDMGDTLTYEVTGGSGQTAFEVDASTGDIKVLDASQLDFEATPSFTLEVAVRDSEGLSDTATVTISLNDLAENVEPVINDQSFSIAENSADGTSIGVIQASDPNAGDTLTYSIVAGNTGETFSLDALTGELTLNTPPGADFESLEQYDLTVQVEDNAGLSDTATVTVTVGDVNEVPLITDQGFVIPENSLNGTVVGQVVADDPDVGDALLFQITGGTGASVFQIDNGTGEITVLDQSQLDFEMASSFTLEVEVTDQGGLTAQATVTIGLTGVNEDPSVEDQSFSIAEDSVNGTVVGTVVATDPDAGDSLSYAIASGNEAGIFGIDPVTGEIAVADASQLDFETTATYQLTVLVTDSGALSDTGVITINLTDVADGIVLEEQSFFKVVAQEAIAIPFEPSVLNFTYTDLSFDTSDPDFVNDAFEAALVDENGNSLVHTIGGGREAFFNLTEGEVPNLANGVSLDAQTVSVNLAGVPTGTQATLILRLVNNDEDVTTSVRVTDIRVEAAAIAPPSGVTPAVNALASTEAIDFSLLSDISPSFVAEYGQTSLNEQTDVLLTDVAIRNVGQYSVSGPLLVAIALDNPAVIVQNSDGVTEDGLPYYDFSSLVGDNFSNDDVTGERTFEFFNPDGVQFDFDVVVLGELNQAPVFTSTPDLEAIAGQTYAYDADATDANGDELIYSLLSGPEGMIIAEATGEIQWTPTTDDVGTTSVIVQVDDGRGGVTEQSYSLAIVESPQNRPPVFTSTPDVDAEVNQVYRYDADALDVDGDTLTYRVASGPAGLSIDVQTGEVTWTPSSGDLGTTEVTITVNDGQGGSSSQTYEILVGAESGNTAPIFISDPITQFQIPTEGNPASGNVNPNQIDLELLLGETVTRTASLVLPDGSSGADIVFVVDESPSMSGEQDWIASMVVELDAALQAAGIEDNRYALAGFGRLESPESSRLFNIQGAIDPITLSLSRFSNEIVSSEDFGPNTATPVQLRLLDDGSYVLIVSSDEQNPVSYDFEVVELNPSPTPFASGFGEFSGSIEAGQQEIFTFNASAGIPIYFDGLSNNSNVIVDISAPNGTQILSVNSNNDSALTALNQSGLYTITVRGSNASSTGDFSFRLVNVVDAPSLTFDSTISGTLAPGLASELYQFEGTAGQRLLFNGLQGSGGNYNLYRLDGQVLTTNPRLDADRVVVLPEDGTYILIADGNTTAGPFDYSIEVTTPDTIVTSLPLGQVVSGNISERAEENVYTFEAIAGQTFYFDGISTDSSLIDALLLSPSGESIASLNIEGDKTPFKISETGTYQLIVEGGNSVTGNYSFRLSEISAAQILPLGTTSNTLEANSSELFKFEGVAGQRLNLDSLIGTFIRFDLYSSSGRLVASTNNNGEFSAALAMDDTYILVVDNNVTVDDDYSFDVSVTDAPIEVSTTGFGSFSGTITPGEQETINITASAGLPILFDGQSNNSAVVVDLIAPDGTEVFPTTNTNNDTPPTLLDQTGTYTLTIRGSSASSEGDYQFTLFDLSDAPTLPLDSAIDESISSIPGIGSAVYQLEGISGQRLYFDGLPSSSGRYDLYRSDGVFIGGGLLGNDFEIDLPESGTYYLWIDGRSTTAPSLSYSFSVSTPETIVTPLVFGETVSASISELYEQDIYTFGGVEGRQIYFDGLTADSTSIDAQIFGPRGESVYVFDADVAADRGPITLTETGAYRIVIDGSNQVTGNYSFRALDVSAAPEVAIDSSVAGTLDSGQDVDIYRVQGTPGQEIVIRPTGDILFGSASELSAATGFLDLAGGFEDGYDGINTALEGLTFRPGAAVNFVLVTDEDRDIGDVDLSFGAIQNALGENNALLNVVINGTLTDSDANTVLGIDADGNAYRADGAGGFIASTGGSFDSGFGTTELDYVDLALALDGAAWDLNQLREGGVTATSFTEAFVDIKTQEILQQLPIDIIASDPTVQVENLTGLLTGLGAGDTATFDLEVTGDGVARSFDLLFVRPESGVVLGSIPVTVNNDYFYLAQAIDADGDALTYRLLDAPNGAVIDAQTGQIQWEPDSPGTFDFVVEVDDGRGGVTTQAYAVTTTQGQPNDAPTITSTAPTEASVETSLSYQVQATDPDGDALSYYLRQAPDGATIDRTSGVIDWTPTSDQSGNQAFEVLVLDGRGGEATQSFEITVDEPQANLAPSIVSPPITVAAPGQSYRYDASATDPDNNPLTFDLPLKPDGMAIGENTGVIYWQPTAEQGGETFDVVLRVKDGQGGVDLQRFQVAVQDINTAPTITSNPPTQAVVNTALEYQVQAQDADNDTLSYQLENAVNGVTIDETTGVLTWTPSTAQLGIQAIAVTVDDGNGGSTTQSFSIDVVAAAPNDPPVINSNPRLTTALGRPYFYQVQAQDPNRDPLTFNLTEAPTGMQIDASGLVTWEPTSDQFGTHTVTLAVSDGRGGEVEQSFTLQVVSQSTNTAPSIDSTPTFSATVGAEYQYDVATSDLEGDLVLVGLDVAPEGMSVDENTGAIRWTPRADQLGEQTVVVRAQDALGGAAIQSFTINVTAINTPPNISSVPVTESVIGEVYTYAVEASDVDNDTLTFSLNTAPAGMTIDSDTGEIQWTPTAAQTGLQTVEVQVDDGQGAFATQTYQTLVRATTPNVAPEITSTPSFIAAVGEQYEYAVMATDANGDALTFSLQNEPAGMTIDPVSGLVQWTPTAGQVGVAPIEVVATDPSGARSIQQFPISVILNLAPTISSTPITEVTASDTYRYDVVATDGNADRLTYTLTQAPDGMTIDEFGRIVWKTDSDDIGIANVVLEVSDPSGAVISQSFQVSVTADTQAPVVNLIQNNTVVELGESVILQVNATDNVGIESLGLTINGEAVTLDSNGRAEVVVDSLTPIEAIAMATDVSGNVGTDTASVQGIDSSDVDAPFLEITSISEGQKITAPTDVIGTVNDDNLVSYTLSVAPFAGGEFVEIASGNSAIVDGEIAQFDPTMLRNDSYILRLTATDAGGNTSTIQRQVNVEGELKLGDFQVAFTDLTIPVAGIPITVSRVYDSLNADTSDDFGFGWSLGIIDTNLRTDVPPSGSERSDIYNPFQVGTRVYVTNPATGLREGYTFTVESPSRFAVLRNVRPKFIPDDGVTSTLSVQAADLALTEEGELYSLSGGIPYNPASGTFGGGYTLTTKEGIQFKIDGESGDVNTVTDRNGNTLSFSDAGILSSTGESVTFERDPQGRITAAIDPSGDRVQYQYDVNGDLSAVIDREGNETKFEYSEDRAHYLDEIVDPLGRETIRNEYDDNGRLTKIIDAQGAAIDFTYAPNNRVTTSSEVLDTDGTVAVTITESDDRGNILRQVNPDGGEIVRTYDSNDNLLTETDALGRTTTFSYDSQKNVLSETDALGNVTSFTYNRASDVTNLTDPLGNTTTFTYSNGNLIRETDALGRESQYDYDSSGSLLAFNSVSGFREVQRSFTYDSLGRQVSETDALGNTTSLVLDDIGRTLSSSIEVTTDSGTQTLTTLFTYDAEGRLIQTTDAEGNTNSTAYNALGQVISETDALDRVTAFTYNDRGERTQITYADGTTEQFEYDLGGRLIAQTDQAGRITRFEYDLMDRLVTTIRPDGTPGDLSDNPRELREYDLAGQLVATVDPLGNRTQFVYDAAGREVEIIDALNNKTQFEYDAAGRQVATIDALGRETQFIYDDLNRVIETRFADGSSSSIDYPELNVEERTDANGNTTRFEYDAEGRLTGVIDALGHQTEYRYDELGRLVEQKDANNNSTLYQYDGVGRRVGVTLAEGQTSSTTYDPVGNVASETDFNGQTITYDYDALNRLTRELLPNTEGAVTYTYTPTGQIRTVIDQRGTTTFTYDAQDRLLSRTEPDGREIAYTYDLAGNRTSVESSGGTTTYSFDALNRIDTVSDSVGGTTAYTFDAVSNLILTEFGNSTQETREYDLLNRLSTLETNGPSGNILSSYDYIRDGVGNILNVQEDTGRSVDYSFDALYRLVSEEISDAVNGDRTITYTYDDVGNRLTRNDSVEGAKIYTYNDNNQLLTEALNSDTTTYTYDANGQLITQESTDGTGTNYTWDSQGRLIQSEVNDGTSIKTSDYEYDFENIRVSRTINGEKTQYLIDNSQSFAQVREESAVDGTVNSRYVHALGASPVLMVRNGNASYYHGDQVDSTRMLTDDTGNATDRYIYDAFGRILTSTGNTDNSYLYTGEQLDNSTGLNYLRARYLDSDTGRFISRDPFDGILASPISRIAYPYGNNNPVVFTDPSGNFSLAEVNVTVGLSQILVQLFPTLAKGASTAFIIRKYWEPAFAARNAAIQFLSRTDDNRLIEKYLTLYDESLDLIQTGKDLTELANETIDLVAAFNSVAKGITGLINAGNASKVTGELGKFAIAAQKVDKNLTALTKKSSGQSSKPEDDSNKQIIIAFANLGFDILSKI